MVRTLCSSVPMVKWVEYGITPYQNTRNSLLYYTTCVLPYMEIPYYHDFHIIWSTRYCIWRGIIKLLQRVCVVGSYNPANTGGWTDSVVLCHVKTNLLEIKKGVIKHVKYHKFVMSFDTLWTTFYNSVIGINMVEVLYNVTEIVFE